MSSAPVDLALKLEFYEIRDLLLGQNKKKQDVKRALELATTCRHPDAQWLTQVFAGKDVKTWEGARDVFLALRDPNDARAVCYSALADSAADNDVRGARLRRSAEMGYAFAQAELAGLLLVENVEDNKEEIFRLSLLAAPQGERDGFYMLGKCYEAGLGCEKNLEESKNNFMLGSELGCVWSMICSGELLDKSDPQRWHWWGEAAKRGNSYYFLNGFSKSVNQFLSDPSLARTVFMIGRGLRGQISLEKREIFDDSYQFDFRIRPANRAIDFFTNQCAAARKAVDAWCLMALRINSKVNKDIRKKIGMMIWEARDEAKYAI